MKYTYNNLDAQLSRAARSRIDVAIKEALVQYHQALGRKFDPSEYEIEWYLTAAPRRSSGRRTLRWRANETAGQG